MGDWAIKQSYYFTPYEVVKETAQFVFYRDGRECRAQKIGEVATSKFHGHGFLPWRGSEEDARTLAAQLTAIRDERDRRRQAADEYMHRECTKLLREEA